MCVSVYAAIALVSRVVEEIGRVVAVLVGTIVWAVIAGFVQALTMGRVRLPPPNQSAGTIPRRSQHSPPKPPGACLLDLPFHCCFTE